MINPSGPVAAPARDRAIRVVLSSFVDGFRGVVAIMVASGISMECHPVAAFKATTASTDGRRHLKFQVLQHITNR